MNIIENFATVNECYLANKKINVKGLMLHSVGCNQPSPQVFAKIFNAARPNGSQICVHAFLGTKDIVQILPWEHRGWHCGSGAKGSANNTHIGVEMTEPLTIKYSSGANFTDNNPGNSKKHVAETYANAIELFAFLCKKFKLEPLEDGVIISHSEGCARGIASNHADPEHIWGKYGFSMESFRNDVKSALDRLNISEAPPSNSQILIQPSTIFRIQVGAFSVKSNAEAMVEKLNKAGFTDAIIKSN